MTDEDFLAWLASATSIRVLLAEATALMDGVETPLYLASRAYNTGAGDTPANTPYLPHISGGGDITETLSLDGQASISYGDIEIGNPGGVRDQWLGFVWANRPIRLYMGDPRWPRADFRLVFDGVVADIEARSAEVLSLVLLDKLDRLNNPLSETLLGGDTANKDRLVPETFGEVHNVEPLLIDPLTGTYQVHSAAMEGVIEVRDMGDVAAATVDAAAGTFTLDQSPVGQITCSVQGDKTGGTYRNTISELVQLLATQRGPAATRFDAGDLDTANLDAFAAAHPQPVGLYAAERTNVLQACQDLAGSVGAQVVMTSLGQLRLVQIALPPPGTPVAVSESDMDYHTLEIVERTAVRATSKLGYCRNWTVQSSGLAAGLPASSMDLFSREWLTASSSDAAVAAVYRIDTEPPQRTTLLLREADAQAEALRERDLWKEPRQIYQARYRPHMLLTQLGDPITFTHGRFDLGAGKTGMVVRILRQWLQGRITVGVLA